jgi:AAA15 family ATPase/GTPase
VIIDFSVKNFRSFREEQRISFVASNQYKDLPENLIDPKLDGKGFADLRLLKGLAIYGANAAGKTNVLYALAYLAHLVKNSATLLDEGDSTGAEPFLLDSLSMREPSEFILRFVVSGVRYHYVLVLNQTRILFESLSAFPKGKEQVWYEREWREEKEDYSWKPARPTDYKRDPSRVNVTRDNALYLSTAVKFNDDQLRPIYLWFKEHIQMLDLAGSQQSLTSNYTSKRLLEDNDDRERITSLLRHADIGILSAHAQEVELRRSDLPKDISDEVANQIIKRHKRVDINLGHRGAEGQEYPLPWEHESLGTQKFFAMTGPWLHILKSGLFAGVDEIESSMHPSMVVELLKLFFSEHYNIHGAQLLFTTHNPILLDTGVMRRDQIWFADKDDEGGTHLYPLTDYKPRNTESLLRGYMSGRYGAIPFIPEGLLQEPLTTDANG